MKKLALLLAVVLVCSFALAACGGSPSSSTSSAGSTVSTPADPTGVAQDLSVCIGPDPETIDPALNSAVDGATMIAHSFEGLLTYQEDGSYGYGQAESFEVSEDHLVYTFHLRDGLKWSDGSPLTANDFVYSWKRVCDPDTAAPYGEIMKYIAGYEEALEGDTDALQVEALDDQTLQVTLAAPCAFFTELCAFPTYSPTQQATIDANGEAWATSVDTYISNGPFMITEWVEGEYILMQKNPNYWNADAITLNSIKFMLMEDSNAILNAYQTGDILCAKDLPSNELAALSTQPDYHLETQYGTYYISFNTQREPLNNPLVRAALSLAIDRAYMAETVMQGTYVAAGNFVGPGFYDADKTKQFIDVAETYIDVEKYEENVEKAKELLAEAGYPNGEGLPTFEYLLNDAGFHRPVAEALQQMWAEIGVNIEIDVQEWQNVTAARRNGDFWIARNGWIGDYNDPSTLLDLLISTNGNNDGKYTNPAYDALMAEVAASSDQEERMAKMHEAEKMLMEDHAVAPIAYYAEFYLLSEKLEGAWHSPLGYFFFMNASVAE